MTWGECCACESRDSLAQFGCAWIEADEARARVIHDRKATHGDEQLIASSFPSYATCLASMERIVSKGKPARP